MKPDRIHTKGELINAFSFLRVIQLFVLSVLFIALLSCQKNPRGLIVGKIRKASKLATTEYTIDKIVYGVKRKKLAWVVNLNFIQEKNRPHKIVYP